MKPPLNSHILHDKEGATRPLVRGCLLIVAFVLLLVGLACVWVLVTIGGKSDGPGALVFYIGAFIGLGGALLLLWPVRPCVHR